MNFRHWFSCVAWDTILSNIFMIFAIILMPLVVGILLNISVTLGRIEQGHSTVQKLQADVEYLQELTSCLEPAREPSPEMFPLLPDIE